MIARLFYQRFYRFKISLHRTAVASGLCVIVGTTHFNEKKYRNIFVIILKNPYFKINHCHSESEFNM